MADRRAPCHLTDKARQALGLPTSEAIADLVLVPLLDIPARDDRRDLRREVANR